ncbi:hypothetical protein [Rhizobium subbaraonis]|nr:hypothetical protein [Rhizobium subbaraonis]
MMTDVTSTPSRRLRKALVIALALPLAAATALPSLAQEGDMSPMPGVAASGDRGPDRARPDRDRPDGDRAGRGYHGQHMMMGERGGDRDRDRGQRRWHHREWSGERLAMRLAAAETAAGIKSAQLDAWRTFTAALVDFATPSRPGDMPGDAQPPAPPPPAGADAGTPPPPPPGPAGEARQDRMRPSGFDMLDRMIARVENRAEKAEKLKQAKQALQAVLEPGQKETIERMLMPNRGKHRGMR